MRKVLNRQFFERVLRHLVMWICLLSASALSPAQAQAPPAGNPGQGGTTSQNNAGQNQAPKTRFDLPAISLSPAVIETRGTAGQSVTQEMTLNNTTGATLNFDLKAFDVICKDGKRVFVPAGELPGSIAATAVFAPKSVVALPGINALAKVTVTPPPGTTIRAVVAMFVGTDKLGAANSVGMTASLGMLITFTLSDHFNLVSEPMHVIPQTDTANLTFSQWLSNTGEEPFVPSGVAAILDAGGKLVGKVQIPGQRLLPGERLEFKAEYPTQLDPGHYRVLASYQYEGKTKTDSAEFTVQ
jgi:archaellum component FlaG (FlaF/FlaG flagellin family)